MEHTGMAVFEPGFVYMYLLEYELASLDCLIFEADSFDADEEGDSVVIPVAGSIRKACLTNDGKFILWYTGYIEQQTEFKVSECEEPYIDVYKEYLKITGV